MWERFEKILAEKGIRTSVVARNTGIDPSTFSDWKRGKSKPKRDKMKKIADYLGVTVAYLMGESDEGMHLELRDSVDRTVSEVSAELSDLFSLYARLDETDKYSAREYMRFLLTNSKYKKESLEGGEVG